MSLERWRSLQRVLARLADERRERPGASLSVEALVLAGWPGERMLARAGATRVYTAIASLRRLGLREVLLSSDRDTCSPRECRFSWPSPSSLKTTPPPRPPATSPTFGRLCRVSHTA